MRRAAPVSAPKTETFRREPGATGQNSCQPEGLQPEWALASLLVLAIELLLPSPGALLSPILAATHTCFTKLGTLLSSKHRVARVIEKPLPRLPAQMTGRDHAFDECRR